MKEFIGCCGLDCEKCDAYIATKNDDEQLREKTAELWSQYNNVIIKPEMINCVGCRIDGVKTPFCRSMCEIKKCSNKKGFSTCGECDTREKCKTLKEITESNPDAMDNLSCVTCLK